MVKEDPKKRNQYKIILKIMFLNPFLSRHAAGVLCVFCASVTVCEGVGE